MPPLKHIFMFTASLLCAIASFLWATTGFTSSIIIESLYQFKDGTWIENIASLSNGTLLFTAASTNVLYSVNPTVSPVQPRGIYKFSDATGALGISEVYPNVFAVITGILDLSTGSGKKGTLCLWTVEVQDHQTKGRKVVCIPDSTLLNGLATVSPGIVFAADSHAGVIYRIDINTGRYTVLTQDPLLAPVPNSMIGVGVNGIQVHKDTLYFTNTDQGILGIIPLSPSGQVEGPAQPIANISSIPNLTIFDDFSLDEDGTVWIATKPDALVRVKKDGKEELMVGNGSGIAGPTATVFGREIHKKYMGRKVLYVTSGGIGTTGGQIFAVQLS